MAYIKPIFREFKPDAGDIIGICLAGLYSVAYTVLVLFAPTIAVSFYYSFDINQQNIFEYYVVALLNVIFIAFAHFVSEWYLLEYNVEYKHRKDDSVSLVKRLTLISSTFGSISSRLITSSLYLIVLIISHLQDLNIYIIRDDFVAQLIQINKFSFIILTALDKVLGEFGETRSHIKYKIKRWLELFYMYRLKIMQKETLKRIEELFAKRRYKKIFFEFGYVVDVITGGVNYYNYLKIADTLDKDMFCKYYIALCNDSLIVSENAGSIDEIIEYVKLNIPADVYKKISNHIINKESVYSAIQNINILLQTEGYSIKTICDEGNKNIILSMVTLSSESIS